MQFSVHVALLVASLLLLPITPDASWKPGGSEDPTLRISALLAATIGLPYFLLATTGPLVQAWYARTHNMAPPYRLFALSNFGSMLALLGYPAAVEPFVALHGQAWGWSAGYVLFTLLCAWAAYRAGMRQPVIDEPAEPDPSARRPGVSAILMWIALPACASILLLAVSNHLCQDIASIPFLWIAPLALYLLTFILSFESDAWYRPALFQWLLGAAIFGMVYVFFKEDPSVELKPAIVILTLGLFVCCMFCHGEVARRRPHPGHLTLFYLMVSLGGAMGALVVAMIAPRVFETYLELPVGVGLCAILALIVHREATAAYYVKAALGIILAVYMVQHANVRPEGTRLRARNFYGALSVTDSGEPGEPDAVRKLIHGAINHGAQYLSAKRRADPITYYSAGSGIALAIQHTRKSAQRVGVIGLGTGTLAAYGRPGDYYRYYEINPLVIDIAKKHFTFLADSKAKVDVALGDARLSLERETPQNFDVLAVDAFSGDSIPVHLLTKQAFDLYFRHLRPRGVLVVHISNKYLDLEPVVKKLADATGKKALVVDTDDDDEDSEIFGATWVLVTDNREVLEHPHVAAAGPILEGAENQRLWTDDYSNLITILK
jgi:SAM-dependent methyltransferase